MAFEPQVAQFFAKVVWALAYARGQKIQASNSRRPFKKAKKQGKTGAGPQKNIPVSRFFVFFFFLQKGGL